MRPSRTAVALTGLAVAGCLAAGGDEPAPAVESLVTIPADVAATARELAARALAGTDAYDFVRDLVVEVGPRFAGTEGDRRAVAWAAARLGTMGFDDVRTEPVTVPVWRRGEARGEILAPYPQAVVLVALGGSVGTPEGGPIEAQVVAFEDLAELEAADPATVAGKIVFLHGRMERHRNGSGYGVAVKKRGDGPSKAAAKGAVALLIRSAGTSTDRFAHTGALRYKDDIPRIPAAALANPDADVLEAQVATGKPVRFRLALSCRADGEAPSANVIAEVRGAERPEEIVLLVAHLDSWDLGHGAVDDGAGCAIVVETGRLLLGLERRPRRTVRVLLTANEEHGLSGAKAYLAAHEAELDRHVVGLEADFGAGRVFEFATRLRDADLPLADDLGRLLAPLGVTPRGNVGDGGADLSLLRKRGLPILDFTQDGTHYFDVHHTANDTLDQIEPAALDQNVATYVTAAWVAASVESAFGWRPAEPATE